MSSCKQCGSAITLVDSMGGVENGPFHELYECVNCGARGGVHGNAEDQPGRWEKSGMVFQA